MKYTLKFNWFEVIFYSFFVTYGYFGLMTKIGPDRSVTQFVVSTLILTLILILFGYLSGAKFSFSEDGFTFVKKDLFIFFGLLIVFTGITFSQLSWALFSDELSYAGAAHLHGIQGLLVFGRRLKYLENVSFQYLAQVVSFLLLAGLCAFIAMTHRFSWKVQTAAVALIFVISRSFIYIFGGNGSPHPSFELIMPFIFGSIFGLNHFFLKFSYLFSSVVFLFFLYKKMQNQFSDSILYLAVFAVGTIPLFLHISTTVEHSLWSGLAISYVFVELLFSKPTPYFRLIAVTSIATMMRQPCFVALVPVLAHYMATQVRLKDLVLNLKTGFMWMLPTLFFIPFVTRSVLYGTPTTQAVGSGSFLLKLQLALKTPIILVSAANNVSLWWLIFIPFVFFTWRRDIKTLSLCSRFFAIAAIVVFYSIHPSVWGHAKYQFEFIVPLSILGFLILLTSIKMTNLVSKGVAVVLIGLCSLNIYGYVNYQKGNLPVDELVSLTGEVNKNYNNGYKGLVTSAFNYKEAFTDIKNLNLAEGTFVAGGSYGVVQEILAGYSLSEALSAFEIYKDQQGQIIKIREDNTVIFDTDLAHSDLRIKAILFGPIPQDVKQNAITKLESLGWKMSKAYSNLEYGSTLVLMLR